MRTEMVLDAIELLHGRTHPRASAVRSLVDRRGPRTRDAQLGALAQPRAPPVTSMMSRPSSSRTRCLLSQTTANCRSESSRASRHQTQGVQWACTRQSRRVHPAGANATANCGEPENMGGVTWGNVGRPRLVAGNNRWMRARRVWVQTMSGIRAAKAYN